MVRLGQVQAEGADLDLVPSASSWGSAAVGWSWGRAG